MKRSTLLSVLICLSLVVAAASTLMRKAERGIERLDMSRVKTARVDHVQITGDSAMELFKDGDHWRTATGREVDPDAIDGLLRAVTELKSSELVEQDDAAQEAVGLTGNTSTRVRLLKETQVLADFVLGQGDMMNAWVRESERSFKVSHLPVGVFRRPAQTWLQRRLFAAVADDVAAVEVRVKGHPSYTLARGEAGYTLTDPTLLPKGFRFNAEAAARLVQNVADARAESIIETPMTPEAAGLVAPEVALRITWTEAAAAQRNETHAQLNIGAEGEAQARYAQIVGKADVVTLPSYVVQALDKPASALRDTTLMQKFKLEDVTSFTVRDGKKQMTIKREGAEAWVMQGADKTKGAAGMLDRGKVLGRLRQVMGVHGAGLAKVKVAKAGFGKAGGDIVVTLADQSKVSLRFGQESQTRLGEPAGYYVQGTGDDAIYVLQRGIRNNLLAMGDSMKSSATNQGLSALGPDALQNLPADVRRAVEAQMAKEAQAPSAP